MKIYLCNDGFGKAFTAHSTKTKALAALKKYNGRAVKKSEAHHYCNPLIRRTIKDAIKTVTIPEGIYVDVLHGDPNAKHEVFRNATVTLSGAKVT